MKFLSHGALVLAFFLLGALPAAAEVRAVIDKSQQRMQVWENGTLLYSWPAGTGEKSSYTPTGTFHPYRFWAGRHLSSKYGTAMLDTVYYKGTRAIHGIDDPVKLAKLGREPVSKGCTALSPEHAKIFYDLVQKYRMNQVTIVIQE